MLSRVWYPRSLVEPLGSTHRSARGGSDKGPVLLWTSRSGQDKPLRTSDGPDLFRSQT